MRRTAPTLVGAADRHRHGPEPKPPATSRSCRASIRVRRNSEIAPEIAPVEGDVVVPKHRWNSFYQTDLDLHFRVRGIETMVIAGGSTDVGIASTVFAARDMDYGIVVISDCCYSARGNNNQVLPGARVPAHGAGDDGRSGRRPDDSLVSRIRVSERR